LIGNVKEWLIEYLEGNSGLSIVFNLFVLCVTTLVVALDILELLKTKALLVLYFIVLTVLIILDLARILLLRRKNTEISTLQGELSQTRTYLRQITRYRNHLVEVLDIKYRINDGGDANILQKRAIRSKDDSPVFMVQLEVQTVGNVTVPIEVSNLNIRAENYVTGQTLEWMILSDRPNSKLFAIVLDPPATRDIVSHVLFQLDWPGQWRPLIFDGNDEANVTMLNETRDFKLGIEIPHSKAFTNWTVTPNEGTIEISESKSIFTFTNQELQSGKQYMFLFDVRDKD